MKDCADDSTCGGGICLPNPYQGRPKDTNGGWYGDIVERNALGTTFDPSTYFMRWDHTHCVNLDKSDAKSNPGGRDQKWANTKVDGAGRAEENTSNAVNVYRCCF